MKMKFILNDIEYKVIEDYRDCFDLEELKTRMSDTDYFNDFDYILGDYAYDKLRLKGFYRQDNKNVTEINSYNMIKDYIKNYCSYGCRYFIIEKEDKN